MCSKSASHCILSMLFAAILTPATADAQTPPKQAWSQEILPSSVLGEDRRILVRLPRYYERDTNDRYPVLYKLDGDNQLQRYHDTIDVLSSLDVMPDVIVVAIPNSRGGRNRDLTPPTLHQDDGVDGQPGTGEMGKGDRFLDFIEKELIPHIDKQYRTMPDRILAGHSRGALLVLYSLIAKPQLFQARFMFSAPLTRDEQRPLMDIRQFFREHRDHRSFLYCSWGELENEGMQRSYAAMKEVLRRSPRGLRWVIERTRAADHQTTQPLALPSTLHHYFDRFRGNYEIRLNRLEMMMNATQQ